MLYCYQRYVARIIFRAISITALVFITLLLLTRLGRELDDLSEKYTLLDACIVAALDLPYMFNTFYAIVFFVGTVCGVAQLMSANAIVILRASGLSTLKIISFILLLIVPILIVFSLFSNSWAALSAHASSDYREKRIHNITDQDISLNQVWSAEKNTVFFLKQLKKDGSAEIMNAFHTHAGQLTGIQILNRPQFDTTNEKWRFTAERSYLVPTGTANATDTIAHWQPQQAARLLWLHNAELRYLTLLDVYTLALRDATLGTENSRYRHELYKRFLAPLMNAAMIILGICLVLRANRSIAVEKQIGLALVLGLSIDHGNKFASHATLAFALPPGLGSLAMIVICLSGAWWLIRSVRL